MQPNRCPRARSPSSGASSNEPLAAAGVRVIALEACVPAKVLPGMRKRYSTAELCFAAKPFLLAHLLEAGAREVHFLDGDCLAYVGPPEDLEHPERIPSRHRFRVFRIPVGSGIAMEPGVWHGAPLAIDAPVRAIVLLLEGTGANDTVLVRFPDDAVEIGGVS